MHNNQNHICRICGYFNEDFPWGIDGKNPTFNFCPCCGVEFGYQDCNIKAINIYRNNWIKNGNKWDDPNKKPRNGSLEKQLKNIPEQYK